MACCRLAQTDMSAQQKARLPCDPVLVHMHGIGYMAEVDMQHRLDLNRVQVSALFFCLCFILTNFVVLNLIIPIVLEQFDLSDSHKRELQRKEVLVSLAHQKVPLCTCRAGC